MSLRPIRLTTLLALSALLTLLAAGVADAAVPRTYKVTRVNSADPTTNGRFGLSLVNVGDVNGDGKADVLTGTDKHGTGLGQGQVSVLSGANGSILRTYQLPDVDPVASGQRASGFGNAVSRMDDIASCPGFGGTAGAACATPSSTGDGKPEHIVAASGVDVADDETFAPGLNNDLGVVYVFDGATGALMKKLIMPQGDRDEQDDTFNQDPRFGRTVLSPGDLTGDADSTPDLLVGANNYSESKATAHPASACATQAGAQPCGSAGRIYVFDGDSLSTGGAGVPLEPSNTIKSPLSLPDDPNAPSTFANSEEFGSLLIPVGDSGSCASAAPANPGGACASRVNATDGKAEFAVATPGFDLFGMEEVGRTLLIDGAKLSVVKTTDYPEPRPSASWGQAQNGTVFPAAGDLADTPAPDFYVPDIQWGGRRTAEGRGFIVNGAPSRQGSFRDVPNRFTDPSPQAGEQFGLGATPIGDLTTPADGKNELLIGAIGPHNPAPNPDVVNDVHIFDPVTGDALQSVRAPDAQPGEGFGIAVAALGDTNGDGFRDFAVGAGLHDLTTSGAPCASPCANAGRVYLFRSDNSPGPPPATEPPSPPGQTPPSNLKPTSSCAAGTSAGVSCQPLP
nr:integrin alpha [Actinomycetota bacterium]